MLNKRCKTHPPPFGENPIFSPSTCCTENVTGTLSNSFEKGAKMRRQM